MKPVLHWSRLNQDLQVFIFVRIFYRNWFYEFLKDSSVRHSLKELNMNIILASEGYQVLISPSSRWLGLIQVQIDFMDSYGILFYKKGQYFGYTGIVILILCNYVTCLLKQIKIALPPTNTKLCKCSVCTLYIAKKLNHVGASTNIIHNKYYTPISLLCCTTWATSSQK